MDFGESYIMLLLAINDLYANYENENNKLLFFMPVLQIDKKSIMQKIIIMI